MSPPHGAGEGSSAREGLDNIHHLSGQAQSSAHRLKAFSPMGPQSGQHPDAQNNPQEGLCVLAGSPRPPAHGLLSHPKCTRGPV